MGARVGVGWFSGSCNYCGHCRRGNTFACETFKAPPAFRATAATPRICSRSPRPWRTCRRPWTPSGPRRCYAPASPRSTPCETAVRRRAIWWRFMGSAGSATWAFSLPLAKGSGPWRSTGAATRKPWRGPWVPTIISIAKRAIPPQALQAMGGAKAIIATVTSAGAMQAISGGLGVNGIMMVIGAVGDLTIDSLGLLGKRAALKGWYSGHLRRFGRYVAVQSVQRDCLDERGLPT